MERCAWRRGSDPEVNERGVAGDIVLENLSLKENALRKFDLPIDVTYGYLGKLVVRIPWSNLMRDPVHIVIDRLYAVATPQFGSDVRMPTLFAIF